MNGLFERDEPWVRMLTSGLLHLWLRHVVESRETSMDCQPASAFMSCLPLPLECHELLQNKEAQKSGLLAVHQPCYPKIS